MRNRSGGRRAALGLLVGSLGASATTVALWDAGRISVTLLAPALLISVCLGIYAVLNLLHDEEDEGARD